jgi:hypothetical protein
MTAGAHERVVHAELLRLGDAPREHELAAHAIAELRLTLHDEHAVALLRHRFRQRRATDAAAYSHEIVCRHPLLQSA